MSQQPSAGRAAGLLMLSDLPAGALFHELFCKLPLPELLETPSDIGAGNRFQHDRAGGHRLLEWCRLLDNSN